VYSYINLAANGLILMDFNLILINPFYPRAKRIPLYIVIMALVGILVFIALMLNLRIEENATRSLRYHKCILEEFEFKVIVWPVIYFIMLIPNFLVIVRLCKKGTSNQLRKFVVKRHIAYNCL
jgi:uncharacterized membrane protein YhaH (DUF805 family)